MLLERALSPFIYLPSHPIQSDFVSFRVIMLTLRNPLKRITENARLRIPYKIKIVHIVPQSHWLES